MHVENSKKSIRNFLKIVNSARLQVHDQKKKTNYTAMYLQRKIQK